MSEPSILIIDNNDSFTYNLAECLKQAGIRRPDVLRPPDVTMERLDSCNGIILSPGPGLPGEHPFCNDILTRFSRCKPILGVCLGHQIIALHFKADVVNIAPPNHGRQVELRRVGDCPLIGAMGSPALVGLYHSWQVSPHDFPSDVLCVTAVESKTGAIMGIRHRSLPLYGVQFHPESILTPNGRQLLRAFADICS